MFCMKCGKPTDGEKMCPECAAKAAAPVQADTEDVIVLSQGVEKPKKKGKKGLIAAIIAAVVVVGAGVGLWLGWDSLFGSKEEAAPGVTEEVKVYNTAEEHMIGVEGDALTQAASVFTDAYGDLRASFDPASQDGGSVEMHLLLGDEVQSLLGAALASGGLNMDMSWLSDVMVSMMAATEGDVEQLDLGVGLGSTKLATLRILVDYAKSTVYMGVPELSSTFMEAVIPEGENAMSMADILAVSQEKLSQIQEALPTEEEVQALLVKYIGVALTEITKVDKKLTNITVNGVTQEVTELTTTISEKDLLEIGEKILTFVKDDSVAMGILEKLAALNADAGYQEGEITEELKRGIDSTLEDIQELKDEASETNYIVLTTYVDARDNVVGRCVTVYSDDIEPVEVLNYKQATAGEAFALEALIGQNALKIQGSGTVSGNLKSGTYTVEAGGQKLLDLKITDLDTQKLDAGTLSGTFLLTPNAALVEELIYGIGIPAYLLEDVAVELKLDSTETTGNLEIRLLSGTRTMLGLTLDSAVEDMSISLPTSTINVEASEEEGMEWIAGMDFDSVISKMKSAGVPEELTGYLEAYLQLLAYYA